MWSPWQRGGVNVGAAAARACRVGLLWFALVLTLPSCGHHWQCGGVRDFPTWKEPRYSFSHLHRQGHKGGSISSLSTAKADSDKLGIDSSSLGELQMDSSANGFLDHHFHHYGQRCGAPPWPISIHQQMRERSWQQQKSTSSTGSVGSTGGIAGTAAPPPHQQWVVRHPLASQYTHMAMVAQLSNGSLAVAYQAAEFAEEGGSEQHIQLVIGDFEEDDEHLSPKPTQQHANGTNYNIIFQSPQVVPVGPMGPIGRRRGAVWGPVLHMDSASETLFLIYSESNGPCKGGLMEWAPGGDIMLITLNLDKDAWGVPRPIYSLYEDGGVPKVTANKIVQLRTGEWVLPFWRERVLLGHNVECGKLRGDGSAGVLISTDKGSKWKAYGHIQTQETWVIENTLVERNDGSLLMLFRTQMGTAYQSLSYDGGKNWKEPSPIPSLNNPDSKAHLTRLNPKGPLAVAFNNHQFMRTNLALALSFDEGESFQHSLSVEASDSHGVMVHYPTIEQVGCLLVIVYSRFYIRSTAWELHKHYNATDFDEGIRVAVVPLHDMLK